MTYGPVVDFTTARRQVVAGDADVRVTSWPTSGPGAKSGAMRFSLRNASGAQLGNAVQIARGDTGWHSFGNVPAGPFMISARALGACLYSVGPSQIYDDGHAFPFNGELYWQSQA